MDDGEAIRPVHAFLTGLTDRRIPRLPVRGGGCGLWPRACCATAVAGSQLVRRRSSGGELDLDCRAPLPEDHLALVSALSQLSLQLRITVVLRHVGDHGAAQIANELCVAERTVWTRMARDRATMAGHLSSHEEAAHV